MKNPSSQSTARKRVQSLLAFFGCTIAAASSWAQPVLINPLQATSPSLSSDAPIGADDTASDAQPGSAGPERQPFQWKEIIFRPHVTYQFVYGSDIRSSTNATQNTIIHTIAPGLAIDLGEHWKFDYTPQFVVYSDSAFDNSVNHALSLNGQTTHEEWRYGLNFSLNLSSDPITETGQQTDQQLYAATLTAGRQLNSSLSTDLSAGINFRLADEFNSSRNYHTLNWLNYEHGPNLGFGLGVGAGYEEATRGSDMTHEKLLARVVVHIFDKLDLSLNGGPEFRQFVDTNRSSIVTAVYGADLTYRMFEPTTIMLSGNRSVGTSFFADQIIETTQISLSLNQRLLSRLTLGLSGGYRFNSYQSASQEEDPQREDENTFFSATLSTAILKRGTISVFYSRSENTSDSGGFSYDSNQVGFTLTYRY